MAVFKRGKTWWYEFIFAGRRVRESAKTTSKTVAKEAEKKRHRELEEGFNGLEDTRDERIKTVKELRKSTWKTTSCAIGPSRSLSTPWGTSPDTLGNSWPLT